MIIKASLYDCASPHHHWKGERDKMHWQISASAGVWRQWGEGKEEVGGDILEQWWGRQRAVQGVGGQEVGDSQGPSNFLDPKLNLQRQ